MTQFACCQKGTDLRNDDFECYRENISNKKWIKIVFLQDVSNWNVSQAILVRLCTFLSEFLDYGEVSWKTNKMFTV